MASVISKNTNEDSKPDLISIINGFDFDVNDAIFISDKNCILTSSEDRSLRLWVLRESGRYWPSVEKSLPSPATVLLRVPEGQRIFVGLDNGTISTFVLSGDLNCLQHERDILAHVGRITDLCYVPQLNWIISTSRDKTVSWFNDTNGVLLGTYNLDAVGTCLQFAFQSKCLFVGDSSGCVTLLSFAKSRDFSTYELIPKLHGHTESLTSLSWDDLTSRLLSASSDCVVILWDIGGGKGSAFELQGHTKAVSSVRWWHRKIVQEPVGDASKSPQLVIGKPYSTLVVSAGIDGIVNFWFMDARRQETPQWAEGDICQLCSAPFFWNLKKMWTDKSVGVRQHHCRRCGKVVCEKCSPHQSVYPVMGFEKKVRICSECYKIVCNEDLKSLAKSFDTRHPIVRLRLIDDLNILLTIGKNKDIKIWDLKSFL